MENIETFADRMKWARTQQTRKISQKELAELAGISQATVNKLENGILKSTSAIVAIADALHVSVHWLQSGQGKPENNLVSMTKLNRLEDTLAKLGLTDEQIKRVEKAALDEAMKIILEQ
ncbi:helix-turn-helix domain-containing protein [Vibrio crassostreae]|uniref:helix-turn-helix domain-containing protein n=1 Tax=Vibrio crassostreae TaxID=246167 RepID=UPI001B30E791|nr:helix-turn-helix transcriptional regulator [Vibrio crassostreae]CAK2955205.1 Helix-turn-helix protein [Vibrio crassostreae]